MARQAKPKSEPFTATALPPIMLDVARQVAQAGGITVSELLGIAESARRPTDKGNHGRQPSWQTLQRQTLQWQRMLR